MSKGLEALKEIKYKLSELEFVLEHNHKEKAPYISEAKWSIIEKELKALEIIKEEMVHTDWYYYGVIVKDSKSFLSKEKYKLLTEVLE